MDNNEEQEGFILNLGDIQEDDVAPVPEVVIERVNGNEADGDGEVPIVDLDTYLARRHAADHRIVEATAPTDAEIFPNLEWENYELGKTKQMAFALLNTLGNLRLYFPGNFWSLYGVDLALIDDDQAIKSQISQPSFNRVCSDVCYFIKKAKDDKFMRIIQNYLDAADSDYIFTLQDINQEDISTFVKNVVFDDEFVKGVVLDLKPNFNDADCLTWEQIQLITEAIFFDCSAIKMRLTELCEFASKLRKPNLQLSALSRFTSTSDHIPLSKSDSDRLLKSEMDNFKQRNFMLYDER